jgi:hypothetical protein
VRFEQSRHQLTPTQANNRDITYLPSHGGDQGFESLDFTLKTANLQVNLKSKSRPQVLAGVFTTTRSLSAFSKVIAALSCMFGRTWEKVSKVIAMTACPGISETILGFTFLDRSSVGTRRT